MNTTFIKHKAIARTLGEMFEGTCEYPYTVTDRWDEPIEPGSSDVIEFRELLCRLAELHRMNHLMMTDITYVIAWVEKIGFKYGQISGNYSTGIYGVRLHELENIKKILSIPEFECKRLDYDTLELCGHTYQILEYRVYSTFLGVRLHDVDGIQNDFSITLNWSELDQIRLGDNKS